MHHHFETSHLLNFETILTQNQPSVSFGFMASVMCDMLVQKLLIRLLDNRQDNYFNLMETKLIYIEFEGVQDFHCSPVGIISILQMRKLKLS